MRRYLRSYYRKAIRFLKENLLFIVGIGLFFLGAVALWASTLELPDLTSPENIKITESTKIYDRTGEIVLFDLNGDVRRTAIKGDEMSSYIRLAAVAIEDEGFYTHNGIKISAILRSVLKNVLSLEYSQGGSTITQQVIKNALLTREKTISRKIKEWILALKLEKIMSKEDILTLYLNTSPYGGNVYGIEEASRVFFSKHAKDLTLSESAYLAALPQAPTYYSPFGNNKEKLENRKNVVLRQMLKNNFISETEYNEALTASTTFSEQRNSSIKAPHFVMFVREQLAEMFTEDELNEGLKIITTLDYKMQEKAEEIVKKWAFKNKNTYNAENAALVAIDPEKGDILTMVGSRDYFDKEIDGNYNIATALRQPGSSFKPIVYAGAFSKGLRPETVVFDVPTEFSTYCNQGGSCYNPENYDLIYRGPMSLRNALAQSVNIPAVKVLYLVGIKDALNLAKEMGITTLTNSARYGLSLVLGGGEVKLLDLVSAYGIFAKEGMRAPYRSILKIADKDGETIMENEDPDLDRVLDENVALQISDILSDDAARAPAFGSHSYLYIPGHQVAVKTGTTNDYRDAWIVGYTPYLVVGAWAGNNDNRSMEKKVAGFIIAPLWNEFMKEILKDHDQVAFKKPDSLPTKDIKPIILGDWQKGGAHSILYYVDPNNILGPAPKNPWSDPQFSLWEKGVQAWLNSGSSTAIFGGNTTSPSGTRVDIDIISPNSEIEYNKNSQIPVVLSLPSGYTVSKADVFVNNSFIGSFNTKPLSFSFIPSDIPSLDDRNTIKVVVYDESGNQTEDTKRFKIEN